MLPQAAERNPPGPRARRLLAALLLVLAALAGVVAGLLALFGAAAIVPSTAAFCAAGLAGLVASATLIGRPAFRRLGFQRPWLGAATFAGALAAGAIALASMTVFRPFPHEKDAALAPDVRYWDLATGSRIAYVEARATGFRRPTPVFFLHGGPGTPGEGLPVGSSALAADGFDVYAYDQVGAGRSARLAEVTDYTVARHVRDLDAIRERVGAERIILIGRSWGAALAMHYAAAHPERVARAILVSPGVLWEGAFPDGETGDPWGRLTPAQRARRDQLLEDPRLIAQAVLMEINPDAARDFVPDAEADARFREIMLTGKDATSCPGMPPVEAHDNTPGFYSNQMTDLDSKKVSDPRPKLGALQVPVLILRGECDFLTWPVTFDYRRTLPRSTLVYVPGAGHGISHDQPETYLGLVEGFLLDRPMPLPAYSSAEPPR